MFSGISGAFIWTKVDNGVRVHNVACRSANQHYRLPGGQCSELKVSSANGVRKNNGCGVRLRERERRKEGYGVRNTKRGKVS